MNLILLEIIRQKKLVLFLALSLIVLNLALSVAASFQEQTVAVSRSKWSELRGRVARSGTADSAALYRQGIVDLEKLNLRIPPKREFARVISELLEAASNSGVVTGPLSYKPVSIKDEALISYQLSFSVSGDYAAVKSYLSDLQQNTELIVVDSVSLTNNNLFIENVVMNLNISVYLREGA